MAGVTALAVAMAAPVVARADESSYLSAKPAVWAADTFVDSDIGFLGCLSRSGVAAKYCFVAYQIDDGSQTDSVRVVTQIFESAGTRSLDEPVIYDEVVPAGALVTAPDQIVPKLLFAADLEHIGRVEFIARTNATPVAEGGNAGCTGHPISYQAFSTEDVVTGPWIIDGTIDGDYAFEWDPACSGYFIGPSSGTWAMPTLSY